MTRFPLYVIVTAARNEARFIEGTIRSMVAQTVLPLKWLIVSDGSTDGTDEIVRRSIKKHPWIDLQRMGERADRNFAGKARAFNTGLASLSGLPYEAAVCLDADVLIEPGYFAYLPEQLSTDPQLGLIGTPNRERSGEMYDYRYTSSGEVSGTCQRFRRGCAEAIGGYVESKAGGIDAMACVSARMKVWGWSQIEA